MWHHCRLVLLLVAGVCAVGDRHASTPVQKVAGLLTRLRDKVQEEGKEEAANYDKFACFCKAQANGKQHAIDRSDSKITELTAAINALGSDITGLDGDVASRTIDLQTEQNQSAAAVSSRQVAQAAYQQQRANLTEAVGAIGSALETLRASREGVRGAAAAALLAKLPTQVSSLVELATRRSMQLATPGTAPAYEYKANDVIATLQSLLRTFKSELTRVQEEEASAQHSFNMIEGARAQRVAAIQSEIDQKQKISAEKSEEKSSKEGLLNEETDARNADQSFLDELTLSCQDKATAWDQRSTTRAAEITAITEAIGILQGMGDLYNVNSKLVGLVSQQQQVVTPVAPRAAAIARHGWAGAAAAAGGAAGAAPALLQLAGRPSGAGRAEAALALLRQRGEALQSQALLALAARNATGSDPFVQVRSLVRDLITRLEAEAGSEATQKSLCDSSMSSAVQRRDQYQAEVESLEARLDATNSEIRALEADVAELSEQVAALHRALNDLTELRSEEGAANNRSIADAQAGAAAVRQAITVLRNFYGPATLLQRNASVATDREGNTIGDLAPTTFSGDYRGKTSESKGIFGLLEVIASDFERTSTTTAAAESTAAGEFQTQSTNLNNDITAKTGEKTTKEGDIRTKESDLVQLESDLRTQKQLHEGAIEELETLKSTCVEAGESWEERKRRREQEIEALKQALAILENWSS